MCLIVNRNDRLVSADEDITVYKLYGRYPNGVHYAPRMNVPVFHTHRGMILSDEGKPVDRREYGIYSETDRIDGGVLHAFTSTDGDFFDAYLTLSNEPHHSIDAFKMVIPKGVGYILSEDGTMVGAKQLRFVRKMSSIEMVLRMLWLALKVKLNRNKEED